MRHLFSCIVVLTLVLQTQLSLATPSTSIVYSPTQNNVSYAQVIGLPVSSPDKVISYGPDPLQFGELWLPEKLNSDSKASLVILIHGGCWLNAYDLKHTNALSTALSQSGYAVWAVEYRRTGDQGGGWPGTYQDVLAAIKFAASFDDERLDASEIALVGHSAGGHLALLAGSELGMNISAVIGLAPIVDIETYAAGSNSCEVATPQFMGGTPKQKTDDYKLANPINKIFHPKTVLIHGDADTIVSIEQSLGAKMPVRVIDGAGHFDMVHPATQAFQKLIEELSKAFK
jgi:acetyl esterase/lipase